MKFDPGSSVTADGKTTLTASGLPLTAGKFCARDDFKGLMDGASILKL